MGKAYKEHETMNMHQAFNAVANGENVSIRPKGNSMTGRIESGQLVTIEPVHFDKLEEGDIVLCKVHGRVYLHLVKALQHGRALIGNNRGGTNGWTTNIVGIVTNIEA